MINQLKKESFLAKFANRMPAQEEQVSVQMDPMDIDGSIKSKAPEQLPTDNGGPVSTVNRQELKNDNALNDALVGAAPALLSLLSGNHNRMVQGFDKSNKYVSGLAKQDMANAKDLKITNQDGRPIYTPSIEAADMQAYVAPSKLSGANSLGGSARDFTPYDAYNPQTGERGIVVFNSRKNEYTDANNNPIQIPKGLILKPVANKLLKSEDVKGTVTQSEYNQYNQAPVKPIKTTEGLGKYYGVETKGQGQAIEKGFDDAQKEFQQNSMALIDAKQSVKDMKNSQDPRIIAAAIYKGARAVEPKGVFTDQDFISITGESYRSWYKNFIDTLNTKGAGEIVQYRDSFLPLMMRIQKRIEEKQSSIAQRYAPSTPKGQRGLENVVPLQAGKRANQAKYILLERAAATRWGKEDKRYKQFMNSKKEELGL